MFGEDGLSIISHPRGPHLERAQESVEKCFSSREQVLQLADVLVSQRRVVLERLELAVVQPSRVFFHVLVLQHQPGKDAKLGHVYTQHDDRERVDRLAPMPSVRMDRGPGERGCHSRGYAAAAAAAAASFFRSRPVCVECDAVAEGPMRWTSYTCNSVLFTTPSKRL